MCRSHLYAGLLWWNIGLSGAPMWMKPSVLLHHVCCFTRRCSNEPYFLSKVPFEWSLFAYMLHIIFAREKTCGASPSLSLSSKILQLCQWFLSRLYTYSSPLSLSIALPPSIQGGGLRVLQCVVICCCVLQRGVHINNARWSAHSRSCSLSHTNIHATSAIHTLARVRHAHTRCELTSSSPNQPPLAISPSHTREARHTKGRGGSAQGVATNCETL